MKKLLLILFLFACTFSFAQQNEIKKSTDEKTISKITSSPNPFTNATRISFYSNKKQKVILTVKNLLGKNVFKKEFSSKTGTNSIPFYRNDLISGIYLYTLQTDEEINTKRLIIK